MNHQLPHMMKWPTYSFRAVPLALGCLLGAVSALGQVALPIEFRQPETTFNYQHQLGVPISQTAGTPPGSNGGQPTGNESTGVFVPPTAKQFQSLLSFGAIPGLKEADWRTVSNNAALNAGTTPFSVALAQDMMRPMAISEGAVLMVLRRAQIGAPFLSRQSSFAFGSVIAPPVKDETGGLLGESDAGSYWLPEPYTVNGHTNSGYYWSPHGRLVYATQPGPLAVTWVKAAPIPVSQVVAYTNPNGTPSFRTNGANKFLLYTERYIVSGGAVKPPRKMYWTQKGFQNIGKPILVPTARVGAVNIVYNNNFPRAVTNEFVGVGNSSPTDGSTNAPLAELRTLWYEQQQGTIYAYNSEGRVFVELLGDIRSDGKTYVPLGTEIVDVSKQAIPADVEVNLGERIIPPSGGSLDELTPSPLNQATGHTFAFQHNINGSEKAEFWAVRETLNQNDLLVHWLEVGEAGLLWPKLFGRYSLVWPVDPAAYSHYVRPSVANDTDAQLTAVLVDPQNAPVIAYQDPLDYPRAKFTPDLKFYTFLDSAQPAHRTLLRMRAGEHIGFERVFSWLDDNLRSTNVFGPVASDLASVRAAIDYPGVYPGLYNIYTNYVVQRARGANGDWKLYVSDDDAAGADGSVGSWQMVVVSVDVTSNALTTNIFTSSAFTIPTGGNASAYPSTITVSGITNKVVKVQAKLNGLTHPIPVDVDAFLVGPRNDVCALLSDAGGSSGITGVDLLFDDALGPVPQALTVISGTYAPTDFETGEALPPTGTGTIGTSLAALLLPAVADVPEPPLTLAPFPDELVSPRVVRQSVAVGQRILAPGGEPGASGAEYLAGYILHSQGNSYHPVAYKDPFNAGFEAANLGAVIPVNAIPGANQLEVWWFRPNTSQAGLNANNGVLGFKTIYWPAVIGRYTIEWPASPREIVLASKLGGTGLTTSEALGTIYTQNVKGDTGYNPNEEHAIMSGGTPFATRDDLNIITQTAGEYSSHPFVLVDFTAPDGRPAMAAFKVLREKPEAGWVFDYIVPAGQMLQPPPPLNFLQKPVEGSGDTAFNYNTEPPNTGGDLPGGWNVDTDNAPYGHYQRFTYRDRKNDFWVYRGPNAGLEPLEAGTYDVNSDSFSPLTSATAVAGESFSLTVHVSRQSEYLSMTVTGAPAWLALNGLTLQGTPQAADVGTSSVQLVVRDLYDNARVTNDVSLEVIASGSVIAQAPLALVSSNSYTGSVITFTNRPPFLAGSPAPSNSFTLRYYYKTLPSFAWPGNPNPPAVGSIVPYLRPFDADTGEFVGAADAKTTASLEIVYRPIWPVRDPKDGSKPVPTLPFAATLMEPAFNLPGVRDFKTAHVLYQQSIAADLPTAAPSVVLHDATRAKYVDITTQFAETGKIPSGIKAELYQGKYYFPNLPPHLATRVFLDPNRGPKGSLGLIGEFKKETLGEDYLMLNVLRGSDLEAVYELCPAGDTENFPKWTALVDALATPVETFYENPAQPGTYIPNPVLTESVGVGGLAEVKNDNVAVDSYALTATGPGSGYVTLLEASGTAFTEAGDPVAMHIFKVGGELNRGELKIITSANPLSEYVTFQHTGDMAGRYDEYEYEWKIAAPVDGFPPLIDDTMSRYLPLTTISTNIPRYTLGGAGIQVLGDNYVVMRYRPANPGHPLYKSSPVDADWSRWTEPALAEGWIKRVLAGINPFNQRINDLFNNQLNTDVSIITQAGRRWEGDVALNLDTINNYGLIEIYETVLRRGRSLSVESGFNYGPANDALLLAAGYLSDLYMMIGNEAWADAANPTIGIGTADNTYGDIATALFAFRGQLPTLLEEELALLRGRDDVFLPGVEVTPVYNRLIWNYTRGIDAGEVIYALNYNIQEKPDSAPDGIINAEDAARMFPQGHGDAYGHYLTSIKGYYSLLANPNFDWVPRIEAVNVLGKPVSVDYQDERKFAAAAAALARAGRQVFDLTWRKDFQPVHKVGWEQFAQTRENTQRSYVNVTDGGTNHPVRNWGLDHWASRVGQGTYLNWVVGNAILPDVDPIPTHEGIQKVDRTTVPELRELATLADGLQTTLDNAEGGLSPLGVPEGGLVFDLNPNRVVGGEGGTHFEQIYQRAIAALVNAVAAFDDAKDVTRLMRSEQDSLAGFQTTLAQQELSYTNSLIELYGTPYPDDIGPGKLYKQGFAGPDLIHYSYVDLPEYDIPEMWSVTAGHSWEFNIQDVPVDWATTHQHLDINLPVIPVSSVNAPTLPDGSPRNGIYLSVITNAAGIPIRTNFVFQVDIGDHGFFEKPKTWTSRRASPGAIQQAISAQIAAHGRLRHEINDVYGDLGVIQKSIDVFKAGVADYDEARGVREDLLIADQVLEKVKFANDLVQKIQDSISEDIEDTANLIAEGFPESLIAGLAAGGDLTSAGRSAVKAAGLVTKKVVDGIGIARYTVVNALELAVNTAKTLEEFYNLEPLARDTELRNSVQDLVNKLGDAQERWWAVNERVRELDDAQRALRALVAQGDRTQAERQVFRQRAAAVVQGYRTRDAAFRLFRNEKLERYKTLFDLSARYALLAANAYDYETGLLGTRAGNDFKGKIIASRALGVVQDGEPQFAGSDSGDPGLSSALAEMKADWEVLRGRLGFNNPDAYGTTVSLRVENERILPGTEGDTNWKDLLNSARRADILTDPDVRRFCLQVDPGNGLPLPGLVLTFRTTIAEGLNLFGKPLAAGDHAFSPSSFATKIFGVGVALEGYHGISNPAANSEVTEGAAAAEPSSWFLDPQGLSATPYIYLIPVGVDSMRSPPLGDTTAVRTWLVDDLAIPMPFNIGGSDFSTRKLYQSADSLTEPLFAIRKHQAFRPVDSADVFNIDPYWGGELVRSQFTNNRLIGRSVWNSQWKLVIPGRTLLNDSNEGLDRFIQTVKDIKLHFVTYSYSGN
jgi:hypothetical protein